MPNPFLRSHPNKQTKGQAAEQFVCQWLQAQGVKVIAQNVHCRHGELDIVARHEDTLVFIEVRYRQHISHGGALASITHHKQQRLIKAALYFLQNNPALATLACRFDVIGVCQDAYGHWHGHWVKQAFDIEE